MDRMILFHAVFYYLLIHFKSKIDAIKIRL